MTVDAEQKTVGGVILCGGKSTRMGVAKATLPFGSEVMLQRVVRIVGEVVEPLVVVTAAGQELPSLPPSLRITTDERPERGPLEGLCAGLAAIESHARAAFVTSCDVPLLQPAFIRRMIDLLADNEIAVPVEDGFPHPLAAIYRVGVLPRIRSLLSEDRLRPAFLFELARTRFVPVDLLRDADPELVSLQNLNRPADYLAALQSAGFQPQADVIAKLGTF